MEVIISINTIKDIILTEKTLYILDFSFSVFIDGGNRLIVFNYHHSKPTRASPMHVVKSMISS